VTFDEEKENVKTKKAHLAEGKGMCLEAMWQEKLKKMFTG